MKAISVLDILYCDLIIPTEKKFMPLNQSIFGENPCLRHKVSMVAQRPVTEPGRPDIALVNAHSWIDVDFVKFGFELISSNKGRVALLNQMDFQKNSKWCSTPSPYFRKIIMHFFRKKILWRSKICSIYFWIENDSSTLWNFSKNSSDLVAPPFPKFKFL